MALDERSLLLPRVLVNSPPRDDALEARGYESVQSSDRGSFDENIQFNLDLFRGLMADSTPGKQMEEKKM